MPLALPHPKWPAHWRRPGFLAAIPLPALQLIGLLVLVNAVVWAAAGILLRASLAPVLTTLGVTLLD